MMWNHQQKRSIAINVLETMAGNDNHSAIQRLTGNAPASW